MRNNKSHNNKNRHNNNSPNNPNKPSPNSPNSPNNRVNLRLSKNNNNNNKRSLNPKHQKLEIGKKSILFYIYDYKEMPLRKLRILEMNYTNKSNSVKHWSNMNLLLK